MHNENAGNMGRLRGPSSFGRAELGGDFAGERRLDLIRRYHHEISADMVMASVRNASPLVGLSLTERDHPEEIASIAQRTV